MQTIFSVTQINSYISNRLDNDPNLNSISVRGEISNCSYSSSGHIYFSVKDSNSQLSCALFRNRLDRVGFKLKDGLSVVVTGSVNVYIQGGRYSFIVEKIETSGTGLLYEQFEKLKKKLDAEGLFDPAHKIKIPEYVRTLGVVTSETGAVLHDIMNVAGRRNPYVDIILSPASVQGAGAAKSLIRALKLLEKAGPDVIIIGRGGGSFEDLCEFNDEELARAIYDCTIPVISAVGHEVDYTICDFVADLRAPTPSAAAELAVFDIRDFESRLVDYHSLLYGMMNEKIKKYLSLVQVKSLKLENLSPRGRLEMQKQLLVNREKGIKKTFRTLLENRKHSLMLYAEHLEGLSPLKKLRSGFSYVTDDTGRNVRSVQDVQTGDLLNVRVFDGLIMAKVSEIKENVPG